MTTVLIADDVSENRYLMTALLQGHGYQVVTAANGAEALSLAQSSPPDLIIADILMPVMDGFELCRQWKRDERLKGIPFVIYTATYTDPEDERLAVSFGADRFLVKPQKPELLLQVARELLETSTRDADAVRSGPDGDELELLRLHNETLTRKLEKKVLQLEEEIAQRAEVESVLRENEKEYRQLVETLQEGIWVVDENARTTFANRRMADILGYTVREMQGKHLISFMDEDGAQLATRVLDRHSRGIKGQDELELVRKDGSRVQVLLETVPITDEAGNRAGAIAGVVDITDRKRLEEQLRVSQRMEAIGSLAGGVAHDFNNLLSVILSYTEFAMGSVLESHPIRSDLLEVKKAAEHAVDLTRQLLAFSRRQMLQPVPLDVNKIATGIEKMLRRILGEDIEYVQKLAGDLGVVRADVGQIEQVLMNLVVNARDAMPEGGKLTVETANVEIDDDYATRQVAVNPGSYVTLAVSDTGCGMDEQTRAQIFEPFFTTKEKGKGTGLGLSTVYGIVKQSGGDIWVHSEPGKGTTFEIYLPRELSVTTVLATRPTRAPAKVTGTETILVVEDEEALRRVAARALEEAGYTVLAAANGEAALRASAQHAGQIDLLVTDVVMPQMSGSALARELAKTRPSLKVAYVSGYADNTVVHQGVLDEGAAFLAKPFTSTDLRLKVREVLDVAVADATEGLRDQSRRGSP